MQPLWSNGASASTCFTLSDSAMAAESSASGVPSAQPDTQQVISKFLAYNYKAELASGKFKSGGDTRG